MARFERSDRKPRSRDGSFENRSRSSGRDRKPKTDGRSFRDRKPRSRDGSFENRSRSSGRDRKPKTDGRSFRDRDRKPRSRDGSFENRSRSSGRDKKPRTGGRSFRDRNNREFERTEVVCSECGTKCEVPFKPRSNKPIFCDACFTKKGKSSNGNSEKNLDLINKKLDKIMTALKIDFKTK